MAPGLRSGRRTAGHPGDGRSSPRRRRSDAGLEGRCLRRTRCRQAGMLAHNCLLSVGMLALLVRCALAAEEKSTYDASGYSSLPSDPTVTAAPANPLADPSVAEEVPFSVFHSDGDTESGGGLSGRPAFSSVLTVMAGTVKHPVSLDQSRTSPTITRDETHTTQWPSHRSSQGSEMSSSSLSAGDRIAFASSGLTSSTSHQHTTPPGAVTMTSTASRPSHVSFIDGDRNVSSLTVSSSSLSSSMSSSAPSTSSVLPSVVNQSSSAGWTNNAASSQGQSIVSSPHTLSPAGSLGWTDSLTTLHPSTHSVIDLSAVTQGLQSTTTKPSHFPSGTSIEKSNEVTKPSLYSSADKIYGVSGAYIRSASTKVIKTPAASTYTSYSPNHGENLLQILYKTTPTQIPGMNSVSGNNIEISTSFPSNQESQAVQRQQGALQNPTSALLSAHPKGHSISNHVTQQMLYQTAYAENENKTAVDSQTFVHKRVGDTITSRLSSHVVNPTVSPPMTLRPTETSTSLSESAITELTPIHPGTVSSEHASNPGDLLMAAGHGNPRVPAIDINYNQGAAAELKSISTQAYPNNSLSLTGPWPESTAGSILRSITRTGTTSSTLESASLHLPSNRAINVQEYVTQTESPKGISQEPRGWTMPKMIFSSNSRTMSLSGSALPVSVAKDMTYKTMYENLSHPTQPTYLLPLILSHSPNNTDDNTGLSASSEVHFAAQPKASSSRMTPSQRQTRSLLKLYATPPPNKSPQTASSTEISPHIIKSERAGRSIASTFEVETTAGNSKTSPASDVHMTSSSSSETSPLSYSSIKASQSSSLHMKPPTSVSSKASSTPLSSSTFHSATGLSASSEVNFAAQPKASSSQMTPSQRQTRSLLKFYATPPPNKSHQTASSTEYAHIIKSERAGRSIASTFELETTAGNSKTSPASDIHMTHGKKPTESFHRNAAQSSVYPLFNENEESTVIRDTAFYKKGIPSGPFTTKFQSFITTKDFVMLNKGSEGFGKGSPSEIPFLPVTSDAALERLFHKDDVTHMSRFEQSSPPSWSEIILTPRTNSASRSQGPITSVRSDRSNFYLGRQRTIPSTASSAATTSSSDGQNSSASFSAIFSFGTKLMAPYTKWKATTPVSFQSTAFELENTSIGFDRAKSNLQADGPLYDHPKLDDGQQGNVHILNSTDPTVVASDPNSFYPTVGGQPSFTYVKGTLEYKTQNLSPANLRSAVTVNVQQGATINTVWGSDGFLPHSHTTTDSVTTSKASSLALVYKNKRSPPPADVDSLEYAFDDAITLSNNPALNFSETDNINNTTDSKLRGLTLPTELGPSSSSFPSSSSSSSETSPLSYSSIKASQSSSLHMKPPTSVSSKASSTPLSTSTFHSTASSSVTVKATFPSSSPSLTSSIDPDRSEEVTEAFVVPTEAGTDELTAGTSRAVALTFPKEKAASLAPSQSVRITLSDGPTERTSQVSPLPPRQDTPTDSVQFNSPTVASATKTTMPSLRVTTGTTQSATTPQPAPVTRRTTTTTTTRSQTSRRTFTPPVPRTSPPRVGTTIFISPFTTTTEAPPQQCNITERLWVKTVVSIYVRRNRLDSIQRQNLRRGLSQGLRKALNDTSAQAQVETVFGSPNMTVAYHVTGGDMVYSPSVVLAGLDSYGRDKLISDLRQYLPMVTALPLPVALWRSTPATGFQLKTVLQFVGTGDDPRSCRFSQMMEQRLEKVFSEAQAKVLNTNNRLSVQMLSVSQAAGSPTVSLVYTVRNGTVFLNGTAASNLLGQLSAELVGYFLFYPPLMIAEPLEYHNLNTSIATRDFWVITVIQDVDNASLEGQYQSFASLMEQRLAELFVLAGQQGTRFRRATAVGSYTVQMVSIRRVPVLKNPAELTYYVQQNGVPLSGASAAKVLNTVDSQTMALTLGFFVQLQAEPVVKNPPNNLWIIAAVLAPIAVVTLIIIIITAVLCRKNKNDFKADAIGNLNPRAKMAYRRDVGYYHQPVQGFDYAKQHLGQQGGDEETLPASQDTLVMSLKIRDTPLSLEKTLQQDGTANKKSLSSDKHKSKLPSEDGSVISNESEKLNSGRGLTVLKVTAQQKLTKEETRKRDDPYDTSSGSLQLISVKPMAAQPHYTHPASSDRSHDSAIVNGEVNLALKQKSDIEHYRNKLRLKAKRKGYYDFPSTDGSSSGRAVVQRQRHGHERAAGEHGRPLEPDDERGSTYVKSHRRISEINSPTVFSTPSTPRLPFTGRHSETMAEKHSQVGQTAYRSRQSLSSPSPGGTEMDLLVMRERPRRGIRNSGYDTEPELIEETNIDRLIGPRGYMYGQGLKGHSETSTLSSQPSIDEVRQQMHLLLEEAFSLASGGQSTSGRHSHHHHPSPDHYSPAPPPLPYADVVTSAPGTMSCGRGGLQWVPSYGAEMYQCSLPKPAFRFTQLPEMAMGSPPPLPPRTGPPPGTSLRRSTSDLGPKGRSSETSVAEMQSQHDNNPYGPTTRAALPSITAEKPVSNYSGNPITAVYAIPATRPGYSEYFVSTPTTSYHSPSWMSYPPEPEDVPPQWADSVPLPGYVEAAFPHPRYPQGSPTRLPLQYNHQALEQPPAAHSTASQQCLPQVVKDMDSMPLSSLSTSALVQAIRQEVAKLAKKQNDVFEF